MTDSEFKMELTDSNKFFYESFKEFERCSNIDDEISIVWMRTEHNTPHVSDLHGKYLNLPDYYKPITNQSVFQWLLDEGII